MSITRFFATLGPIGYFPASGTCASFVTMGILYWLYMQFHITPTITILIGLMIGSLMVIGHMNQNREKDPRCIVLDEVVGACCVFWAVVPTFNTIVWGFIFFRVLDIFKPWPLYYMEHLPGPIGIVADDVSAGIISNGILWYLVHICYI